VSFSNVAAAMTIAILFAMAASLLLGGRWPSTDGPVDGEAEADPVIPKAREVVGRHRLRPAAGSAEGFFSARRAKVFGSR
jgi:hypothetical protein